MKSYQQEVAEAEQRGRAKGRHEAAQRVVLKQLRLRFGELPEAVVTRIQSADVPELELWVERMVTASHLEDVLGPAAV